MSGDAAARLTPLAGLRVLDLADEWGILTGNILADLGADVVAVEPPGGSTARRIGPFKHDSGRPQDSLFWAAYARNKRGITLNLDTAEGRGIFRRLARHADVVVESHPPGWLDARGAGFLALAEANPRLIMVSVTPFGQDGPKAAWPATDLTVMAASNYLLWVGDKDRPPLHVPFQQAAMHASAEAATGCLVALRERRRSACGQHVAVSAQVALTNCTQAFILASAWEDVAPFRLPPGPMRARVGLSGIYEASDGYVAIGFFFGSGLGPIASKFMEWVYAEGMCDERDRAKDWVNFVSLLQTGEESEDELGRIHDVLDRFTRSKTKQQLLEGALARGLLLSPAFTVAEVLASPQLAYRNFWTPAATGVARKHPGPFARFSESPLQFRREAPRIGEHNAEVFSGELGLSPAEIGMLAAAGAI